jgi:hypothetical protein
MYAIRQAGSLTWPSVAGHTRNLIGDRGATARHVANETGVGRPVIDLFDTSGIQADVRPITIAGGHEAHRGERMGWKVPKKCLVSTMQLLLQGRRLTVAKSLPFAAALAEELQTFQIKVTEAANETFGALGEGYHDDLVLAIMIAAWAAEWAPNGMSMCTQKCNDTN